MTSLRGKEEIRKDDASIHFRGCLDTVESIILYIGTVARKSGEENVAKCMGELLDICGKLMRADVLQKPMNDFSLMGMSADELHERSHFPDRFYGCAFSFRETDIDEISALINILRTKIREMERWAVASFARMDNDRQDIIQAVNRLSSAAYVMLCARKVGEF